MDLLASRHRNLMVVGDDSQSIYSFRGANYENIMRFPDRYPDCQIFKLETNYRSTPEILHLANLSITNNENQFQKTLRAVRERGDTSRSRPGQKCPSTGRFRRPADPRTPPKRHSPPGDGRPLPRPLPFDGGADGNDPRGIPFEIRSGIRFFEQAHIKDVTGYLRIIVNPRDELAWKRVLGLYAKIGRVTAEKIWRYVSALSDPLMRPSLTEGPSEGGVPPDRRAVRVSADFRRPSAPSTEARQHQPAGTHRRHPEKRVSGAPLRERYTDAASREEDLLQLANFSSRFSSLEDFPE